MAYQALSSQLRTKPSGFELSMAIIDSNNKRMQLDAAKPQAAQKINRARKEVS
ncbi:MAG: hypothetical protein ACJASB_002779 [Shewanella psychromarinicola]|jgi:hypothetical protein